MHPVLKPTLIGAALLMSAPVTATPLLLEVEIPRLDTAEYHRPYVAVWLESADRKTIKDIALWYQQDKANEGRKWLKDLRQWWRLSGRSQEVPAEGVSGATRPVGVHEVKVPESVLADLPAGDYSVVVEASREKGGRELVRLPLAWPADAKLAADAQGTTELGKVSLRAQP